MGNNNRSALLKKPSESARLIFSAVVGVALGFFFGVLFQTFSITSLSLLPNLTSTIDIAFVDNGQSFGHDIPSASKQHINRSRSSGSHGSGDSSKRILSVCENSKDGQESCVNGLPGGGGSMPLGLNSMPTAVRIPAMVCTMPTRAQHAAVPQQKAIVECEKMQQKQR